MRNLCETLRYKSYTAKKRKEAKHRKEKTLRNLAKPLRGSAVQNTIKMKVKIPCGKCNDYYEYQSDDQNIIGLTGEWSDLPENTEQQTVLISEKPKTGHQYSVLVFGALLIDLEKPVWITYFDPHTTYNGIENDEGINSMTICKCNILHYTDVNPKKIRLTVEVVETIGLGHTGKTEERMNDETLERLEKNYNDPYCFSIENYEKYSFVSLNFQSDWGWNYIVEKANNKYRIVAENFFDFHKDTWQIRNEKLTDEQADKYGIR